MGQRLIPLASLRVGTADKMRKVWRWNRHSEGDKFIGSESLPGTASFGGTDELFDLGYDIVSTSSERSLSWEGLPGNESLPLLGKPVRFDNSQVGANP
jgi:hypothetical protein